MSTTERLDSSFGGGFDMSEASRRRDSIPMRLAKGALVVAALAVVAHEVGYEDDGLLAPALHALPGSSAEAGLDAVEYVVSYEPGRTGVDVGNDMWSGSGIQAELGDMKGNDFSSQHGGRELEPDQLG